MMKLNRLFLSQNISVDNALSMNQILHQIVNQIKEIVDFINNLELRANEYTDQEILKLKNDLESQLTTLEQTLKTYTNDKIDEYNVDVINPQLTEIRNTIDTLNRTINERIDDEVGVLNRRISSVESTLNKKIDDTKEYLEELIKKGNQLVYSSISGRKIPIQDTLFEMGNALKQILSYNWNSIDEFKQIIINGETLLNTGFTLITNSDELYIKQIYGGSPFTVIDVSTYNDIECIKFNTPLPPSAFSDIKVNDVSVTYYNSGTYFYIPLEYFNNTEYIIDVYTSSLSNTFKLYNLSNGDIENYITFNSIKLAMQELNVNWNALIYTGVNTFYELNETEKMYDTTGIKSDYFVDNKYKTVHNNFESDFFKSNINEGNGGN